MGKVLSIIFGTAAAVLGTIGLIAWWTDFIYLLKGCVPPILILGGAIALFAGVSELKDSLTAKKKEEKKE